MSFEFPFDLQYGSDETLDEIRSLRYFMDVQETELHRLRTLKSELERYTRAARRGVTDGTPNRLERALDQYLYGLPDEDETVEGDVIFRAEMLENATLPTDAVEGALATHLPQDHPDSTTPSAGAGQPGDVLTFRAMDMSSVGTGTLSGSEVSPFEAYSGSTPDDGIDDASSFASELETFVAGVGRVVDASTANGAETVDNAFHTAVSAADPAELEALCWLTELLAMVAQRSRDGARNRLTNDTSIGSDGGVTIDSRGLLQEYLDDDLPAGKTLGGDSRDAVGDEFEELTTDPIAMLPIRLETRFVRPNQDRSFDDTSGTSTLFNRYDTGRSELRIRMYPDQLHIDEHEAGLTPTEEEWGKTFWAQLWYACHGTSGGVESLTYDPGKLPQDVSDRGVVADLHANRSSFSDDDATRYRELKQRAWGKLVERFDRERAAWIVHSLAPEQWGDIMLAGYDEDGAPWTVPPELTFPKVELRPDSWSSQPTARLLPDRWIVVGTYSLNSYGEEQLEAAGETDKQSTYSESQQIVVHGNAIDEPLYVGPNPETVYESARPDDDQVAPEGMEWMVDYEEAEKAGMALRLTEDDLGIEPHYVEFDQLSVFGVKSSMDGSDARDDLTALLESHKYTHGLAFLEQGTPSNNHDVDSGYRSTVRPEESLDVECVPQTVTVGDFSDGDILSRALGINPGLNDADDHVFSHVKNADRTTHLDARAMNTVTWPGTFGYYLRNLVVPNQWLAGLESIWAPETWGSGSSGGRMTNLADDWDQEATNAPRLDIDTRQVLADALTTVDAYRDHFQKHVRGRGPFPPVRVGRQPYGVLPVSQLSAVERDRVEDEDAQQTEIDEEPDDRHRVAAAGRESGSTALSATHGSIEADLVEKIQSFRTVWTSAIENVAHFDAEEQLTRGSESKVEAILRKTANADHYLRSAAQLQGIDGLYRAKLEIDPAASRREVRDQVSPQAKDLATALDHVNLAEDGTFDPRIAWMVFKDEGVTQMLKASPLAGLIALLLGDPDEAAPVPRIVDDNVEGFVDYLLEEASPSQYYPQDGVPDGLPFLNMGIGAEERHVVERAIEVTLYEQTDQSGDQQAGRDVELQKHSRDVTPTVLVDNVKSALGEDETAAFEAFVGERIDDDESLVTAEPDKKVELLLYVLYNHGDAFAEKHRHDGESPWYGWPDAVDYGEYYTIDQWDSDLDDETIDELTPGGSKHPDGTYSERTEVSSSGDRRYEYPRLLGNKLDELFDAYSRERDDGGTYGDAVLQHSLFRAVASFSYNQEFIGARLRLGVANDDVPSDLRAGSDMTYPVSGRGIPDPPDQNDRTPFSLLHDDSDWHDLGYYFRLLVSELRHQSQDVELRTQEFATSLEHVGGLDPDHVEQLFTESLDLAGYRLDAWWSSIATRRLFELRAREGVDLHLGTNFAFTGDGYETEDADEGVVEWDPDRNDPNYGESRDDASDSSVETGISHVGAYGFVEDLEPDIEALREGEATTPEFTLAPSPQHATTAAILRGAHKNHEAAGTGEEGNEASEMAEPLKVDLTADRVRKATSILDGLGRGQRLGEMLGYRFERGLLELTNEHRDGVDVGATMLSIPEIVENAALSKNTVEHVPYAEWDQSKDEPRYVSPDQETTTDDSTRPVNLARYKFPFRVIYPTDEGIGRDEGSQETTPDDIERSSVDVVNGHDLVQAWERGSPSDFFSAVEAEDAFPETDADTAKVRAERALLGALLSEIEDVVDAMSDLLLAEDVHQLATGNFQRAGTSIEDIASGERVPETEVIETPPRDDGVTHRTVVVLGDRDTPTEWRYGTDVIRPESLPQVESLSQEIAQQQTVGRLNQRATQFRETASTTVQMPYEFSRSLRFENVGTGGGTETIGTDEPAGGGETTSETESTTAERETADTNEAEADVTTSDNEPTSRDDGQLSGDTVEPLTGTFTVERGSYADLDDGDDQLLSDERRPTSSLWMATGYGTCRWARSHTASTTDGSASTASIRIPERPPSSHSSPTASRARSPTASRGSSSTSTSRTSPRPTGRPASRSTTTTPTRKRPSRY